MVIIDKLAAKYLCNVEQKRMKARTVFVHYPSYSLNFGAFAITSASRFEGSCS